MKSKYLVIISLVLLSQNIAAQEISKSFELRYFTNDAKANGETDFKGETEYFDTEQRVEYLSNYAEAAKRFFDDPDLDGKVVDEVQLKQAMQQLKPQPLPEVRKRERLNRWKWMGYKPGQRENDKEKILQWTSHKYVTTDAGKLKFNNKAKITVLLDKQSWRFFLEWQVNAGKQVTFQLIGENLYMRTKITPDDFERANLVFETLDPGGEIWLNGQVILVKHNRHPGEINISNYLVAGKENIVAVKVYPNKVEQTNRHTAADLKHCRVIM